MSKKPDNSKDSQKNQHIQVFVRCRPLNAIEKRQCSPSVVNVISEKNKVIVKEKINEKVYKKTFSFDKVFGPATQQVDVYRAVVQPLIAEVLMGYNCTVFAYGQTGTGKTYTMEGERNSSLCSWEEDPAAGIIPRSLHQLFEELTKENKEFSVRVSFLELYNEELFDLLSPAEDLSKLRLFEDSARKGSVVIQGLEEVAVHSKDEVYAILEKGTARRQTAATMMNASSSRSHTVFSVIIHIKENTVDGEELLKTGKLNLVDLAGNENIGRSGAVDKRAREAGSINQSLLTLGRVITSLVEKASHIPYRESKLTRLLQDSLGGHTKTSIIATISPAQCNAEETASTLDYAHRAMNITNRPEVNQRMTKRALIKEYTEEIERLRRDLVATRNKHGIFVDPDTYRSMENKLIYQTEELKSLQNQIDALNEQKEKVEQLFLNTKKELDFKLTELDEQNKKSEQTRNLLENTSKELDYTRKAVRKTATVKDEKQYLIKSEMKTEKQLSQQAKMLIEVADRATTDVSALHAKINRKHVVEQKNEEASKEFKASIQQSLVRIHDKLSQFINTYSKSMDGLKSDTETALEFYYQQQLMISSGLKGLIGFLDPKLEHLALSFNSDAKASKLQSKKINQISTANLEKHSLKHQRWSKNFCGSLKSLLSAINMQQAALQKFKETVLNKLKHHEATVLEQLNKNKILVTEFLEYQESVFGEQNKELKDCLINSTAIIHESSVFKKDFDAKMNSLQLALNAYQSFVEEYKNNRSNDIPKVQQQLDCLISKLLDTQDKMERKIDDLIQSEERFAENSNTFEQDLSTLNKENINDLQELTTDLSETQCQIKKDVPSFFSEEHEEREADHEGLKKELEPRLVNLHQDKLTYLNEMKSEWDELVSDQESQMEAGQKKFDRCSSGQLDSVNEANVLINHWAESLKDEIMQQDLNVEKFLTEDLQRDRPTGETPERTNYIYPQMLSTTSPHERILARFRLQQAMIKSGTIPLPLDDSFDESEVSKDSITSKKSSDTCPEDVEEKDLVSSASEDSTISEAASYSCSSLSDRSSKRKKNRNLGTKPSNLPRRIPSKKTS